MYWRNIPRMLLDNICFGDQLEKKLTYSSIYHAYTIFIFRDPLMHFENIHEYSYNVNGLWLLLKNLPWKFLS